jgi:Beta-lactamase
VADVARWAAAVARGRLLTEAAYRQMFMPARLGSGATVAFPFRGDPAASYGMGWFLTRERGVAVQTHGGAIAGFSSVVSRFPVSRFTVIVLSNGKDRGDRMGQAEVLARAVAGALAVEPETRAPERARADPVAGAGAGGG